MPRLGTHNFHNLNTSPLINSNLLTQTIDTNIVTIMTKYSAAHLVFIPAPAVGHLVSTVEIAKLLLARDQRLSITLMLMKLPFHNPKINNYSQTLPQNINYVDLPLDESATARLLSVPRNHTLSEMVEIHKPRVKDTLSRLLTESTHRVALVVDMFCTPFMDVARDLGFPSYVFLTSGAAFLGLTLSLQTLRDDENVDIYGLIESGAEFDSPSFVNRLPSKALPPDLLENKTNPNSLLNIPRFFRQADGILVNTFAELEPYAIKSFSDDNKIPRVYPVGPLLNLVSDPNSEAPILAWLEDQPPASVLYLCFGSRSIFEKNQIGEIGHALERAGCRFIWSLPEASGRDFLPEGFSERMAGIGMVIEWAPQVAILSHPSVGGFVSHCGWNSTLESMWFGVPMGAWPRMAEQHMNAFELVSELGLAVEIKIDSSKNNVDVSGEEIEIGIRKLMDLTESREIREKVKEMKKWSRGALLEGGSSYNAVGSFIEDLIADSN